MYQQFQRGQSYTFTTQDEWRTSLNNMSSSPTAVGSDNGPFDSGSIDFLSQLDVSQLDPSAFADHISTSLSLTPKHRSDLHTFVKLVDNLSRSHSIPMIYSLATNFYTQQLILDSRTDYAAISEILNEVKNALAQNLDLTKEQKAEVTAACKSKVWDPKRSDFDNDAIRVDVLAHLKKHQANNGFKPLFDSKNQARTKSLQQFIGLQASYAKSHFRTHIKDSLPMCATMATTAGMRKMVGSTENISPLHAMRMLILRDFARNNKELLGKDEQTSNKRARVGDSDTIRKGTRGTDADSWWPSFTTFLEAKNKEHTVDLKSPGWSGHIGQIVVYEHRAFPNDTIPLVPISEATTASSRVYSSGEDRAILALPRSGAVHAGAASAGMQASGAWNIPPLRLPDGSSSLNGFTLPSMVTDRQAGILSGSSMANQQNQSHDGSYSRTDGSYSG
ncbi:hypothetical protein B0H11DRAFT_2045319 [Mycena galericulata]|nr:hypothetical protein B0H11DRAFT_2045319 [Mycena galericulata]